MAYNEPHKNQILIETSKVIYHQEHSRGKSNQQLCTIIKVISMATVTYVV